MQDATRGFVRDSFWVALASVGLLAACGAPSKSTVDPGGASGGGGGGGSGDVAWNVDTGSTSDTSPGPDAGPPPTDDAGSGPDGGTSEAPVPKTFHLVNRTDHPVRIQAHARCEGRGPDWLRFPDFQSSRMTDDCTVCRCDDGSSDTPCAVCAKACGRPTVRRLQPGERLEWRWAGYLYRQKSRERRTCYRRTLPQRHTNRVEFCWSEDDGSVGRETTLEETTCETMAFQYDRDRTVTHEITDSEDEEEPSATTFELTNDTNRPIRVRRYHDCTQSSPKWVSVKPGPAEATGSTSYRLESGCSTCSCDALRNGSCAVCKRRCAPPRDPFVTLQPGETRSWQWEGYVYRENRIDGTSCHRKMLPPRQKLRAEFCWSTDATSQTETHCRTVRFEYGEKSTVRHEVTAKAQPQETKVRLVNKMNQSIRIERGKWPCNPGPDWFSIRKGGKPMKLATSCRTCSCRTTRNGTCGACSVTCNPGAPLERMSAGDSVEWTWDGWFYQRSRVNGQQCMDQRLPRPGETYDVRMCWSDEKGPVGAGHELKSSTCKTIELTYGQDAVVVHEVKPN